MCEIYHRRKEFSPLRWLIVRIFQTIRCSFGLKKEGKEISLKHFSDIPLIQSKTNYIDNSSKKEIAVNETLHRKGNLIKQQRNSNAKKLNCIGSIKSWGEEVVAFNALHVFLVMNLIRLFEFHGNISKVASLSRTINSQSIWSKVQ